MNLIDESHWFKNNDIKAIIDRTELFILVQLQQSITNFNGNGASMLRDYLNT